MELNPDICWKAVQARDARFDGRFFTGVVSTGIYCRPVCPARTPHRKNVVFHPSAASAEAAGLRACLRCRPETAPDMAAWRGSASTVSRAMALIEAGALDGGDVDALAQRLGVGERHLRRLFRQHLGAAPVSVAQTRRVLLAKTLIHDTDLSMAEVALASGFGSVRRFNETFQTLYGRPPSELRRRSATGAARGEGLTLHLAYRPPYDLGAMLEALRDRAAPGEAVADGEWRRGLSLDVDGTDGEVRVRRGGPGRLWVAADLSSLRALPLVLARVRCVFDLAADAEAIARDLSADPVLASAIARRPGLHPPGCWTDEAPSGDEMMSDDPALWARAEAWRPWRAYGALYWRAAVEREETT